MKKRLFIWLMLWAFHWTHAQGTPTALQETETKRAVENFFVQFGSKNPDQIAQCFSEQVDWYIFESTQFPWTGRRTQRSEIPKVFETLFSYFVDGHEKFELQDFLVDGDQAAVFAQLGRRFKNSGKDFSMLVALHFVVEKGLIKKFYLYEQTTVLEKAYKQ
ncbi:nuclear transport factor 2 family protein [Flavobacterium sp.]|uniref:nuclear transport factor 2 family protein n=1 Tax=Flavobacterium sp. TaxID=239 RepID=UPI0039E58E3A